MAKIVKEIIADENTYQFDFYQQLFGKKWYERVSVDRSTDGYMDGTIFEHKSNVKSYGCSKALSQALIYLCRFNRDGIPVPKNIFLVSQDEEKIYCYDANNYIDIINNIQKYANLQASIGIPKFKQREEPKIIDYEISATGMSNILRILEKAPEYVKVNISVDNVYGWSIYYYQHSKKPTKINFFKELRNPKNELLEYINKWSGEEKDFSLIMDLLNDPATQKSAGAFYTPPQYGKKTAELIKEAIKRVPKKQDYIILDRCAGTGALEYELDDDILSHIIISTYELKEWHALKDRLGGLVRYIIPPVPKNGEYPNLVKGTGFLEGTNALTKEYIEKVLKLIKKLKKTEKVNIILLENPPFRDIAAQDKEITGIQDKSFVYYEFIKAGTQQAAHREIDNLFIWSGFNYFLKDKNDSYILISPIKYFKDKKLNFVNHKKFVRGFAFNREHFHNSKAVVTSILWSNENIKDENKELVLEVYDISDGKLVIPDKQYIKVKSVNYTSLNTYNPKNNILKDDKNSKVVCSTNGESSLIKNKDIFSVYNENIIGYLRATSFNFNANSWCLTRTITTDALIQHYGFYLRKDDFYNYLPLFAAKLFPTKNWYDKDIYFTSADGGGKHLKDKNFIKKCLIYCCLCQQNHCISFNAEKRLYKNELCFENGTVATKVLDKFIKDKIALTEEEKELINNYKQILKYARKNHSKKMKKDFTYGIFQLENDVDTSHIIKDKNGKTKKVYDDGDFHDSIRDFKNKVSLYYEQNISLDMIKYELVK